MSSPSAMPRIKPQIKPLTGQRALVTGAAKRIGRGIALALAHAGADIAITYNHSAEEAFETVDLLQQAGVRAQAVACDLHDPAAIVAAMRQIVLWPDREAQGNSEAALQLDILVNNAGAFETTTLDTVTPEQWDNMFLTNTRAPLLVAQAALPALRASKQGGRIVNIGSLGGLHPWATHAHYCASKAAVHMLTQTMAKSWAPEVAVNCVAPGMIVTSEEADEAYAHLIHKTPMRRNGKTSDVAEVVLFLASATMFLTGQVIAVDGGLGL